MPNNCQLIAGKINTERIAARAIEKLSRLYSNKTHFIYELIQNSDDARSDELYISMEEDELWLWHHGRPFTEENVIAICSVGESSKDLTQIGTHGVGFKAVYVWTDAPEIYSGDWWFRIENYIRPETLADTTPNVAELLGGGYTIFRLPFKPRITAEDRDKLGDQLAALDRWTLLFLHHLRVIKWGDRRAASSGLRKRRTLDQPLMRHAERVELSQHGALNEQFLVFRTSTRPKESVISALLSDADHDDEIVRIERSAQQEQPIEVAFRIRDGEIVPEDQAVLFSYLPTAMRTGLRFLIQARYQTTPARDTIIDCADSPWNAWLTEATADFIPDILLDVKDASLLKPSFYAVLPKIADKASCPIIAVPLWEALYNAIVQALDAEELVLTRYNTYAVAHQVFRPHRNEVAELFDIAELESDPHVAWLHSEVSAESYGVLKDAGVREIGFADIVAWLEAHDATWFKSRETDWLNRLYRYLATQDKSAWGRLRDLPLVRLESGEHCVAALNTVFFSTSDNKLLLLKGIENADLPFVSSTIELGDTQNSVKSMLQGLGVLPLDGLTLVRSWLLPLHRSQEQFSKDRLCAHFDLLLHIMPGIASVDRDDIVEELQEYFKLWAYQASDSTKAYYTTGPQVYLSAAFTDSYDLDLYFSHTEDAYFLDPAYLGFGSEKAAVVTLLREMGAELLPRRRLIENAYLPHEERAALRKGRDYTGGTETVMDYSLHGLQGALQALQQSGEHQLARAIWNLNVRLYQLSGETFFQAKYSWSRYRMVSSESTPAAFVKKLRNVEWLPDENGVHKAPHILHAPTNENRTILGESVAYLHSDFDIRDTSQSKPAREFARGHLNISLSPNVSTVLDRLIALSQTTPPQASVSAIYEFFQREQVSASTLLPVFSRHALVYLPATPRSWWSVKDVLWEDAAPLFGGRRGYLKPAYPGLRSLFVGTLEVAPNASMTDFLKGVSEIASEVQMNDGCVSNGDKANLISLYRQLRRELERVDREPPAWLKQWESLLNQRCWLGTQDGKWQVHLRADLVRNDHPFLAGLFAPVLPFWSLPPLSEFAAQALALQPCSDAQVSFVPIGDREPMPTLTQVLRYISPWVRAFLQSPTLTQEPPRSEALKMLSQIEIHLLFSARVEYRLKNVVVEDEEPLTSFLDETTRTLWITLEAAEQDYSFLVGDALQRYYRVPQLREFIDSLLIATLRGQSLADVLRRWKRDGLVEATPLQSEMPEDDTEETSRDLQSVEKIKANPAEEVDGEDGNGPHVDEATLLVGESASDGSEVSSSAEPSASISQPLIIPSHLVTVFPTIPATAPVNPQPSLPSSPSGHGSPPRNGQATSLGGHGGGGGEGLWHQRLKNMIAANPTILGSGLTLVKTEYRFQTGDTVDVLLRDATNSPVTVEVEGEIADGNLVGMMQASKYQHLAAVEDGLECGTVRTILVAPQIPPQVKAACVRAGVEPVELGFEGND